MMLTGDRVDGRELLRLGVVEDCLAAKNAAGRERPGAAHRWI